MHPGGLQVGRVPQDDGTGDEVQRARPMALGLQRMIADTADAMEEDGAFQGIFRFSLVEFAGGAATLFGLLDPVEREQGTLDATDLASPQALYAEQRFSGHNVNIGVRQRREGTGRGFRG
jgi:hypothetical protein